MTRALVAVALLALRPGAAVAADPAHVSYMLQCQGCHLADGTGKPGEVPSLPGEIGRFLAVPGGREYLVQVPGAALSPLGDAELAAVLNWVVGRFTTADERAGFRLFEPGEVGRLRREPLMKVEQARATLLGEASAPPAVPSSTVTDARREP